MTQVCQALRVGHRQAVSSVNETQPIVSLGRPRRGLTPAQRYVLEALAAELARHRKETQATRVKLVLCAREAHAKGASIRAIAEAVALSRARVHALINSDEFELIHDPTSQGGSVFDVCGLEV